MGPNYSKLVKKHSTPLAAQGTRLLILHLVFMSFSKKVSTRCSSFMSPRVYCKGCNTSALEMSFHLAEDAISDRECLSKVGVLGDADAVSLELQCLSNVQPSNQLHRGS